MAQKLLFVDTLLLVVVGSVCRQTAVALAGQYKLLVVRMER